MRPTELDIGKAVSGRTRPRKAALEKLERLLRAHQALAEQRPPESPYGLLRPAQAVEIDLIEATFLHCGVPLPDILRAIYRRTLGVGNPISPLPVLAVPFLRAALPDEGYGCPVVGLAAFEKDVGHYRDDVMQERPPFLSLGQAGPLGLTVSRNGLWSVKNFQAGRILPQAEDFNLVFEAAFSTFVDQVLLLWANDLAGAPMKPVDIDLTRGIRSKALPRPVQDAMGTLLAPRALEPRTWGEVQPLDNVDLLRTTSRIGAPALTETLGPYILVVGLPYGDHPEVAGQVDLGAQLRLRPVDDNPHDPNAVEVWYDGETSARIGFVSRVQAPPIQDLPEGASAWRLRVVGRSDRVIYTELERLPAQGEDSSVGDRQRGESEHESYDLFSQCTRSETS